MDYHYEVCMCVCVCVTLKYFKYVCVCVILPGKNLMVHTNVQFWHFQMQRQWRKGGGRSWAITKKTRETQIVLNIITQSGLMNSGTCSNATSINPENQTFHQNYQIASSDDTCYSALLLLIILVADSLKVLVFEFPKGLLSLMFWSS